MGFLHLPSKIFKNMAFFLLVKVAIWPSGLMDTLDIFVQQIRLTAETGTFGEGLIGKVDWKNDPPLAIWKINRICESISVNMVLLHSQLP